MRNVFGCGGSSRNLHRLLTRHRLGIGRALATTSIAEKLCTTGTISESERDALLEEGHLIVNGPAGEINGPVRSAIVEIFTTKGFAAFRELCVLLEMESPQSVHVMLKSDVDTSNPIRTSPPNNFPVLSDVHNLYSNHDALRSHEPHLSASSVPNDYKECRQGVNPTDYGGTASCEKEDAVRLDCQYLTDVYEPPVEELKTERVAWEYHAVELNRVPGFGFGIAVSGGRDNPHFTNGDTSIAISDVLPGGPADGKLKVNDRVLSANGISLGDVEYGFAVKSLRDSGNRVQLLVKRRVPLSPPQQAILNDSATTTTTPGAVSQRDSITCRTATDHHIRMTKSGNSDIILGLQLVVAAVNKESSANVHLHPGDIVTAINGINFSLSNVQRKMTWSNLLTEANRHLESVAVSDPLTMDIVRLDPAVVGHQKEANSRTSPPSGEGDKVSEPPSTLSTLSDADTNCASESQTLPSPRASISPRPRVLEFIKQGNVGIRLIGGNQVGIFVTAVQPGSAAANQGLEPGDQILEVNGSPMTGVTREEAVLLLLSLRDRVKLRAHFRRRMYDEILRRRQGDSFYIRTHFDFKPECPARHQIQPFQLRSAKATASDKALTLTDSDPKVVEELQVDHLREIGFSKGHILHVVDTLHSGVVGSWRVRRLEKCESALDSPLNVGDFVDVDGIIPNGSQAEDLASQAANDLNSSRCHSIGQNYPTTLDLAESSSNASTVQSPSSRAASFFRRRREKNQRRSKSLGKDHWDELVWAEVATKFPPYERINMLPVAPFVRPVIIYGPVADLARQKLIASHGDQFRIIAKEGEGPTHSVLRLSSVVNHVTGPESDGKRHVVLDVMPAAIDRLNFAQVWPIVILMHTKSKQVVKECRNVGHSRRSLSTEVSSWHIPSGPNKWSPTSSSLVSARKLLDECDRLLTRFGHIFTACMELKCGDTDWLGRLLALIAKEQAKPLWVTENPQPMDWTKTGNDEYLFPMSAVHSADLIARMGNAKFNKQHSLNELSAGPTRRDSTSNDQLQINCEDNDSASRRSEYGFACTTRPQESSLQPVSLPTSSHALPEGNEYESQSTLRVRSSSNNTTKPPAINRWRKPQPGSRRQPAADPPASSIYSNAGQLPPPIIRPACQEEPWYDNFRSIDASNAQLGQHHQQLPFNGHTYKPVPPPKPRHALFRPELPVGYSARSQTEATNVGEKMPNEPQNGQPMAHSGQQLSSQPVYDNTRSHNLQLQSPKQVAMSASVYANGPTSGPVPSAPGHAVGEKLQTWRGSGTSAFELYRRPPPPFAAAISGGHMTG